MSFIDFTFRVYNNGVRARNEVDGLLIPQEKIYSSIVHGGKFSLNDGPHIRKYEKEALWTVRGGMIKRIWLHRQPQYFWRQRVINRWVPVTKFDVLRKMDFIDYDSDDLE